MARIWYDSSRDHQGNAITGQIRLDVTAEGNATGVYSRREDTSLDGELYGHLTTDGRTLEGRWASRNGQQGRFVFHLRGGVFRGFYSMGDAAPDGNIANLWDGSRREAAATTLSGDGRFSLLVQCYPSSRDRAEQVVAVARGLGLKVEAPQVLRERQLVPRKSEILFFSDASRTRGLQLQEELRRLLGLDIPVSASEYYPDAGNVGKLRINLF